MRLKQNVFKTKFGDLLTKLGASKRFQLAIYLVFHEESESEVQNTEILQENLKISIFKFQKQKQKKTISGLTNYNELSDYFNVSVGL